MQQSGNPDAKLKGVSTGCEEGGYNTSAVLRKWGGGWKTWGMGGSVAVGNEKHLAGHRDKKLAHALDGVGGALSNDGLYSLRVGGGGNSRS